MISDRMAALEEAFAAKRPALTDFTIQELETEDGPLYRVLDTEGKCVSPMFFSKNCLDHFVQRMPLLTFEEWDNHPLIDNAKN